MDAEKMLERLPEVIESLKAIGDKLLGELAAQVAAGGRDLGRTAAATVLLAALLTRQGSLPAGILERANEPLNHVDLAITLADELLAKLEPAAPSCSPPPPAGVQ